MVLISGEPGIRKSRLGAALAQYIRDDPHTRLRYFCSPHHQDSALYPSLRSSNAPPGLRATTQSKRSSPNCEDYSRVASARSCCWPSCCRCRAQLPT